MVKIFNVAGQLIRELAFSEIQDAGYHELVWDGRDNQDRSVPTGVYIARLDAGVESQTVKLVTLK